MAMLFVSVALCMIPRKRNENFHVYFSQMNFTTSNETIVKVGDSFILL